MKDLHVQRTVTEGWTNTSLKGRNEAEFRKAARKAARSKTAVTALIGALPFLWLVEPVRATIGTPLGFAIFVASAACGIICLIGLFQLPAYHRRPNLPLHLPGARSNDPYGAVDALDALLEELRAVPRSPRRLAKAYEDATERLQKLHPDVPLRALVRQGYYPSRPVVETNGRSTYLDHDASADHVHWDRMSAAADDLRATMRSSDILTENEVRSALSSLVPPLRAVLRTHGVATHRIEYLPPKQQTAAIADASTPAAAALPAPVEEPEAMPDDALSPVEDRLNASATMAVSAVRTLALSLQAAEDDLFTGDDLQTGRTLMAQHVPSLVRAYIVAHDASQGEERDQIRAEFAAGVGVVRDTLAGIMRRHAQEARRRMEDETRFLRMRHGEGDDSLSPASETPVF
jgi:hypothetical protein